MSENIIYEVADLVEVTWREDIAAVSIKWFTEYDEGTGVRDAVLAALDYVHKNDVRNWFCDLSTSRQSLTPADREWVSSEAFTTALRRSPLRKFLLVPPLPETGQDVSWLDDWEANTLASLGDRIEAKLSRDPKQIRRFFMG